jgi:uncharacterized protein (TIGR03086 family)
VFIAASGWQAGNMPRPMDAASRFDRRNTPLTKLVDAVPDDAWGNASPCAGWSAADVLQHMIDTQRTFMLQAGASLPHPEPTVADGPAMAWRTHAESIARALADDRIGEKPHETPFGPSTVGDVFDAFYGFDLLVHRWDVARATGGDARLTDAELDTIEQLADSWGDQLYADGVCAQPIEVGDDEPREVRVLARLGRDARQR